MQFCSVFDDFLYDKMLHYFSMYIIILQIKLGSKNTTKIAIISLSKRLHTQLWQTQNVLSIIILWYSSVVGKARCGLAEWVWLVRDVNNERADELGVADAEGVCRGSGSSGGALLRAVGTWAWLLGGIWRGGETCIYIAEENLHVHNYAFQVDVPIGFNGCGFMYS